MIYQYLFVNMSKKNQLSKFCRIFPWIEMKDPAFAGAIRDLCMEGNLSPGRRFTGITFLYPKDKTLREEIVKKAYSDDAGDAIKLIESLIMPVLIHTAEDFRGDIGTKLGIKLHADSITDERVKLKCGVELTKAPSFKTIKRDNISVWIIESGTLPLTGEEFKAPIIVKKVKGGGTPIISNIKDENRYKLAFDTEILYAQNMYKDRCLTFNPYLAKVVSLLNFLRHSHPSIYHLVLPIIDRDPTVSFYLLIEPYKTIGGNYLIPSYALFGEKGWNGAETYERAVEELEYIFNDLENQTLLSGTKQNETVTSIPKVFSDPLTVRRMVVRVKDRITSIGLNKMRTPTNIRAAYNELETKNMIDIVGPIFPDTTLLSLANGKKLWQDELRFLVHAQMEQIQLAPFYTNDDFTEVVNMLKHQRPGNDYYLESSLSNPKVYGAPGINGDLSPTDRFGLLEVFLNSTDFMYIPVSEVKIGAGEKFNFDTYDPNSGDQFNAERSKHNGLHKHSKMVRDGLPSDCIIQVQAYVNRHGSLPPELTL